MDSQARLTHPLQALSWKASGSVGQTARWVPWEKTACVKIPFIDESLRDFQSRLYSKWMNWSETTVML